MKLQGHTSYTLSLTDKEAHYIKNFLLAVRHYPEPLAVQFEGPVLDLLATLQETIDEF